MADVPVALKLCAGCVTDWAVELQVVDDRRDSQWLCPSCAAAEAGKAAAPLRPGSRCVHADYRDGPFSVLLVTSAAGSYIDAHPIGFPDLPGFDGRSRYHRGEVLAVSC